MSKRRQNPGTFCSDCDFAGDVPFDSELEYDSRSLLLPVNPTFVFDSTLNMSKGIVDVNNPEKAPSKAKIIANCGRSCIKGCSLDRAGLMAVEVDDDAKRDAMLGLLNSFPAVARLGEVIFDEDDGEEDDSHEDSDTPSMTRY